MIRSMTGYAQAAAQDGPWSLTVAVRSLNHRYFDAQFRLPPELMPAESRFKKAVRAKAGRGHIEVQMRIECGEGRSLQLNKELAGAVFDAVEAIRAERGFKDEPDIAGIFRLPGILRQSAGEIDEAESEKLTGMGLAALDEALDRLNVMRESEGEALLTEFQAGVGKLRRARDRVSELSESVLPAERERLQKKLREMLGDGAIEESRLAEEAAYRAEKADISEELLRLGSHCDQFLGLLSDGDGESVGKRLDFLLQEMNREANTILSKTPGTGNDGIEMTRFGLEMKSEIERLREQAQNVE